MWQVLLGQIIEKLVEDYLKKKASGQTPTAEIVTTEGKRMVYAYADHVLTEVQALLVKEPQNASDRIDQVRAGLKLLLGIQ